MFRKDLSFELSNGLEKFDNKIKTLFIKNENKL